MTHTPLRDRIAAVRNREARRRTRLIPVIDELKSCNISYVVTDSNVVVISRGQHSDVIMISACDDGFFNWGLGSIGYRHICLDDLLEQIAEILA